VRGDEREITPTNHEIDWYCEAKVVAETPSTPSNALDSIPVLL